MSTTDATTAGRSLPAAWYRDPSGRHERRWWDGDEWTDRVADGDQVTADPPVRSRPETPVVEERERADDVVPVPQSEHQDGVVDGDADAAHDDDAESFVGLGELSAGRRPPAERPSTGVEQRQGPRRSNVIVGAVAIVAVVASVLWGYQNHSTASEWRDRGEALQEELVTRQSNADALEEALSQSASRGAQAQDGQQAFNEMREAAVATVDQLRTCAFDLNEVMMVLQQGGDPTATAERANRSCTSASLNGEGLIQALDQLAAP